MKYADINKRFTDTITEYILKGYAVNTSTMGGSQGDVAKVDFTNGKEIIRIRLNRFYESGVGEGYEIIVGKCTDKVEPNSTDDWSIIWNDHLEVLSTIRFYKIGVGNSDYYGEAEEANSAASKRRNRRRARGENYFANDSKDITAKAMELAKRIIRREFGLQRIAESRVRVIHHENKYTIYYNGRQYILH